MLQMAMQPWTTDYPDSSDISTASITTQSQLSSDGAGENETYSIAVYPSYWSFGSYPDADGIVALRLVSMGIVIPIFAVAGITTNALNVAVLLCLTKKQQSPIYRILLAMAAADILVMTCYLVDGCLNYMRPDPVLYIEDDLRLSTAEIVVSYVLDIGMNAACFTSNWCTVAMATCRFVAVYFPLKKNKWCARPRVTAALVTIVVIAALITVPPRALKAQSKVSNLTAAADLPREYEVTFALLNDVLPWILCVVLVSLLLATLRKPWAAETSTSRRHERQSGKRWQLTATLIATAAWFVITTAPSTVTVVIAFWDRDFLFSSTPLHRLFYIAQVLVLMNYNGNIFFYSLINSRHRDQLRELLHLTTSDKRSNKWAAKASSKHQLVTTATTVS